LLGLWLSENEGAKFWLSVLTELKNRGVKDVFIACVDGLTGFPEAIAAAFPRTQVQLCIVHRVRNSLCFVSWKDRCQWPTEQSQFRPLKLSHFSGVKMTDSVSF
jgi:putative transposase